MSFNVISTREILPDISFFMNCLRDSLRELLVAVKPARKSAARKKPAKKKVTKRTTA
jgi:hypothetical protein